MKMNDQEYIGTRESFDGVIKVKILQNKDLQRYKRVSRLNALAEREIRYI